MQSVQYRNMTDEELIRLAYMQNENPLILELCSRIARLVDENRELSETVKDLAGHIPH